jgi:excisionase family DNA binding protein
LTKLFSKRITWLMDTEVLSAAEAAARLGVSVRRVQQMVKNGQLPATVFGGALMIQAKDLELVAERKVGRPPKAMKKEAKKK